MKLSTFLFSCLFSLSFLNHAEASEDFSRLSTLSKNIRCVTCGGQSIEDSPSDFARQIKHELMQRITQGQSDEQIFQALRVQYGDDVLFNPPLNTNTIFLWTLPILLSLLSIFLGFYRYYASRTARTSP